MFFLPIGASQFRVVYTLVIDWVGVGIHYVIACQAGVVGFSNVVDWYHYSNMYIIHVVYIH